MNPTEAVLASIQVGLPRTLGEEHANDPMDRCWTTAFFKEPVSGPVALSRTQLEGDGQADVVHHGGPEKAVLAYSADHYPAWRQELSLPDLPSGAFGENFTINGLTEADVCIGDTWQIGPEVLVQVSQPRQPCWKLARRWRIKDLALLVQQSGRTGWYLRVLQPGTVEAGMTLVLRERPYPQWTVARANEVMHVHRHDLDLAAELAAIPLLAGSWQDTLRRRAQEGRPGDTAARLVGENG
jgi:MOSC domain-containing protein YiiM